ncbi:hypothetical protein Poly41_06830 [Novipirellula artificiosorum]|uniref:PD-(D/E)XK nuclease superfamily protein n=1 Tax=Novipirellula artificiosorum TaxID=2528016 RepID=A0A5C6E4M6_9BACT|nr:hypothetical protein Poly41_06830 [Novipirellula artificiosorum]
MNMTINDSAFSAYLDCPYRAFLTLQRQVGTQRHFETLRSRLHKKLIPRVEAAILRAVSPQTHSRKCRTTVSDLRRGSPLILNTVLASPRYSCRVAALQRVDGPSSLGDFYYTPIVFHEDAATSSSQKLLLAFAAKVLGRVQGNEPTVGHVIVGTACTLKRVLLKPFFQQAEDIISERKRYSSEISRPRQLLNSHCRVCPYHDGCESEATSVDHLSRLESISATEIDKLNARGIFTVHQLSYTFRPRKRPKRQGEREYIPYHHSLWTTQ